MTKSRHDQLEARLPMPSYLLKAAQRVYLGQQNTQKVQTFAKREKNYVIPKIQIAVITEKKSYTEWTA